MSHRDYIIIKKVLSEISVAFELMGESNMQQFLDDENNLKNYTEGFR